MFRKIVQGKEALLMGEFSINATMRFERREGPREEERSTKRVLGGRLPSKAGGKESFGEGDL